MDYENSITNVQIDEKLNNVFCNIIKDIPNLHNKNTEIATIKKGQMISYGDFLKILYNSVLEYVPKDNENILIKIITKLPKVIKNINHFSANIAIIKLQNKILNDYFYSHGDKNIKLKLEELKANIKNLVNDGEYEMIDAVIESFDDWIRNGSHSEENKGFLNDMKDLADKLEKRGK